MNFGANHYVPVLKIKRGEKDALSVLANWASPFLTPLLEVVENKTTKSLDAHIDTAFKGLAASVETYQCFVDTRELSTSGSNAATKVFARAAAENISFVPVTGISRTHDVAAALGFQSSGVAIRITREEFEAPSLSAKIVQFLNTHSLNPENIHLILDLGAVEMLVADGIAALTAQFLPMIPFVSQWRTFTISGCAFPKSMGGVKGDSHAFVDRSEWLAWRDGLYVARSGLPRLPTFSDCAIQHPAGVEGFDPRVMAASASARYATGDQWLLVKGTSTKKTTGTIQFPKIAKKMTTHPLNHYFKGAAHCPGCKSIVAAAAGAPKLGSAEAWRRLGTIHHLATVVADLSALSWP
jgi:hypothetical protein